MTHKSRKVSKSMRRALRTLAWRTSAYEECKRSGNSKIASAANKPGSMKVNR